MMTDGRFVTTHGDSRKRLYKLYMQMVYRCHNSSYHRYCDYGGRGISVCQSWKYDYTAFKEWAVSHGYDDSLTIERIDVDGNYCPMNCTWIPSSLQASNRRTSHIITAFGESKIVSKWVQDDRCKVNRKTLSKRVGSGWGEERAIVTPPRRWG